MEQIITKQLREIEEKEKVRIIAAVESGSRAWGFASPDSDYDVRFIYVRKPEDYLRLDKIRDVIKWQLDEVLDINGWDLKKALQLMHDSNPTIFEWCASPILYKSSDAFIELQKIRSDYFSVKKSLYHYWHMANSNYQTYLQGKEVKIKKYFYVIRPLLAAEWIVEKGTQPPMLFSELMREMLPDELKMKVNELLEMKQIMPEMGIAPKIKQLDDYIDNELMRIKDAANLADTNRTEWKVLNEFFYNQVEKSNY